MFFSLGQPLHFSYNPSQRRSYRKLSMQYMEQCVHLECVCVCVRACVYVCCSELKVMCDLSHLGSVGWKHRSESSLTDTTSLHLYLSTVSSCVPFFLLLSLSLTLSLTLSLSLALSLYLSSLSPPSRLPLSGGWWSAVSVQGEVGCPWADSFKAPHPPRHEVSCILKYSIVSASPLSFHGKSVLTGCVCVVS